MGAAAVVLVWVFLAGGGEGGLEADPGIPPPEYAYLDNARVLAYLAQIEGGLSEGEKRARRVTETRTGGVSVGGVEAGGSAVQDAFVEEVVTPTATTRFYRLLDRLAEKGYLRDLNAAAPPPRFTAALADVPEGFFVRLTACRLRLPTYVQMDEMLKGSRVPLSADRVWTTAMYGTDEEREAGYRADAATAEAQQKGLVSPNPPYVLSPESERRLTRASKRFAAAVGRNPRVPLASCTGRPLGGNRKPDLLFPVELNTLTRERSVLAGPVTLVGKLVRQVRAPGEVYVDRKAVAAYKRAVDPMDEALAADFGIEGEPSLSYELLNDASVLPPGAVVLPIAIYK